MYNAYVCIYMVHRRSLLGPAPKRQHLLSAHDVAVDADLKPRPADYLLSI